MKLYSESENYKLYHGSMLDMLEVIEKNSIDSIITDPPYELNFMGRSWDRSGIAFQPETWRYCYEVLKPGGYLLAFGGSRTFHRIAVAIEDAGFEIRDVIMWLYGSGFPKSMNIGLAIDKSNGVESEIIMKTKAGNSSRAFQSEEKTTAGEYSIKHAMNEWAGWGTALKPAYEPVIVARKPLYKNVVQNILKYGVGGMNIDECRIETTDETRRKKGGWGTEYVGGEHGKAKPYWNSFEAHEPLGRFPANVILTYDDTDFDEVCGNMPETSNSGGEVSQNDFSKYKGSMMNVSNRNGDAGRINAGYIAPADSGNACRYFYNAKASKKDRDEGLFMFAESQKSDGNKRENPETARMFGANSALQKNVHPTVKPTDLMQYLIRLVSPAGATILDCFNGSGSTGKAVMLENNERGKNYKYIGIELTTEYLPIAKARIEYAEKYYDTAEEIKDGDEKAVQLSLFEEAL